MKKKHSFSHWVVISLVVAVISMFGFSSIGAGIGFSGGWITAAISVAIGALISIGFWLFDKLAAEGWGWFTRIIVVIFLITAGGMGLAVLMINIHP